MFNKIINIATWGIFTIGFLLTSVVVIAQTSVPGDSTYGIKTGFEKIVLSAYRLVHKDTDYQIDLTKLRFKESQQVLKSAQGGESLANLNLQILSTQENINNIQDSTKKATFARKYISTLKEIKTQIDYEKISLVDYSSTTISLSSTTTPPELNIKDDLDDTRNNIDDVIKDLEENTTDPNPSDTTAANPTTAPIPTLIPTVNPTTVQVMEPTRRLPQALIKELISPTPDLTPALTPSAKPTTKSLLPPDEPIPILNP